MRAKAMGYSQWIPWLISAVSVLFAILTYVRNGRKDFREETKEDEAKFDDIGKSLLKANMKLDQVCATTNETRTDIKSMNKDLIAMDRRLTIVEQNMKTVFSALDDLKGRVGD